MSLYEFMISPLMSCHMIKLWQSCEINCGTRLTPYKGHTHYYMSTKDKFEN